MTNENAIPSDDFDVTKGDIEFEKFQKNVAFWEGIAEADKIAAARPKSWMNQPATAKSVCQILGVYAVLIIAWALIMILQL